MQPGGEIFLHHLINLLNQEQKLFCVADGVLTSKWALAKWLVRSIPCCRMEPIRPHLFRFPRPPPFAVAGLLLLLTCRGSPVVALSVVRAAELVAVDLDLLGGAGRPGLGVTCPGGS